MTHAEINLMAGSLSVFFFTRATVVLYVRFQLPALVSLVT